MRITWCILSLKGLRTDDITDTIRQEEDGRHGDFLRVAGTVGHGEGGGEDVGSPVGVKGVVGSEETVFVLAGEFPHEEGADEGDQVHQGDGSASDVGDFGDEEGEDELPGRGDDSGGDSEAGVCVVR